MPAANSPLDFQLPGLVHRPGASFDRSFRFGLRAARLRTDDVEFGRRFLRNFQDCAEPPGSDPADAIRLRVSASANNEPVTAEIEKLDGRTVPGLFELLFPEIDFVRADPANGWHGLRLPGDAIQHAPAVAVRGSEVVIRRNLPWQRMLAHFALTHLMRLQPQVLFFHAATCVIGQDGILLCGDKGAGKSTLSLALAARGHGFLGDEIAAIDREQGMLLPFRRQASVRDGPQAEQVARYLAGHPVARERLSDGTLRYRESVSVMFPRAVAAPARFTHAFFLRSRAPEPRIAALPFSMRELPLLTPLHATLLAEDTSSRVLSFLSVFRSVRCHLLHPGGTPDDTADAIERAVHETRAWVTA